MGLGITQAAIDVTAAHLLPNSGIGSRAALGQDRERVRHDERRAAPHPPGQLGRAVTPRRDLPNKTEASVCKAYGPPTFERIIRRCMQLLGPDGANQDLLLEKWYRDSKILDIFEGSAQVQRIIIGRTLMGHESDASGGHPRKPPVPDTLGDRVR